MGYTNKTSHYDLPQWIAGDKPSWLGDMNTAMLNIDTAISGADASATAAESSAAAANAQVQAQEAKITKNTTDIQALTESLADTQGEVNNVKTTAEGALPKSGGTMTGNLILNAAPTSDLQAATKKYVDDNSGRGALMLSGGTMTGPLTLSGEPTADLMAATKKYVDDHSAVATKITTVNGTKIFITGHIIGNTVNMYGNYVATGQEGANFVVATATGNPLNLTQNERAPVGLYCGLSKDGQFALHRGGMDALFDGSKTNIICATNNLEANVIYTFECFGVVG